MANTPERKTWSRMRTSMALGALCFAAAGCADHATPHFRGVPAEARPITVQVENQNFQDVAVYVSRSGDWQRIGNVTGTLTRDLEVPDFLTESASQFRIRVHAIGSSDSDDYVSDPIVANPGEEVRLIVRSVIRMSSYSIR